MPRKKWNEQQEKALNTLSAAKQYADALLEEDIKSLLVRAYDDTGYASDAITIVQNFLLDRGQETLDMLLQHYEPSPQRMTS